MNAKTHRAVAVTFALLAFLGILPVLVGRPAAATDATSPGARSFEFTYKVHVAPFAGVHSGLRLWIPLPASDPYQRVSGLRLESGVAHKVGREAAYGNRYEVFDATPKQAAAGFDVLLRFDVVREEHRVARAQLLRASAQPAAPGSWFARDLHRDRLVPLDGVIADLAREHTAGARTPLEKARRIYDYVVATMRYDKSGQGWGRGDAVWACTAKRGNCTDFHSLFIGMMRASGIPARFEIGFPLPGDQHEGEIPGYHCWAEFHLEGVGWVPVDASEAWKNPPKKDYFFGAHDTNRVLFTYGRDLRLGADQKGGPLNYFIYPYAEADGEPVTSVQSHFAFRDLPPGSQAAGQ